MAAGEPSKHMAPFLVERLIREKEFRVWARTTKISTKIVTFICIDKYYNFLYFC